MTNPNDPQQPGQPQFPQAPPVQPGYPAAPGYPVQGQPQGYLGYPGMSAAQVGDGGNHRPATVNQAFLLWLAVIGLSAVILLLRATTVVGQFLSVLPGGAGVLVFNGIVIALWGLFAFMMRAGRNWARGVLTALGVLSVAWSLIGLRGFGFYFAYGGIYAVQAVLELVQIVVMIAAMVVMFLPAGKHYFAGS